jgi:hypothetical protein
MERPRALPRLYRPFPTFPSQLRLLLPFPCSKDQHEGEKLCAKSRPARWEGRIGQYILVLVILLRDVRVVPEIAELLQ